VLELLAATVVVALLVALGLGVLYGLTVVPFLLVVDLAERRGLSTGRWAGWGLVAVVAALALAVLAWRLGAGAVGVLLVLTVAFVPALVLRACGDRVGGPAGRHESPV
jgi:hypothetical protein